jgi:hypothetical protein
MAIPMTPVKAQSVITRFIIVELLENRICGSLAGQSFFFFFANSENIGLKKLNTILACSVFIFKDLSEGFPFGTLTLEGSRVSRSGCSGCVDLDASGQRAARICGICEKTRQNSRSDPSRRANSLAPTLFCGVSCGSSKLASLN